MIRQEKRLQRKMMKIDSLGNLKASLKNKTDKCQKVLNGQYFGYLDTLSGSLGFLKDSKKLLDNAKGVQEKLKGSMDQVKALQGKLQQAENIKQYIRERRELLKSQLSQYTSLTKDLQKIKYGKN